MKEVSGINDLALVPKPARWECGTGSCDLGLEVQVETDANLAGEGYELEFSPDGIRIRAGGENGDRRARATLAQMRLQAEQVSCGVIRDSPRFGWRGLMLDVARHYFPVRVIRRVMDLMALLKLRVLHLHLTDDQGWRVPIEKWPLLTEVGAVRAGSEVHGSNGKAHDGIPHGGFYTREELRELVEYAADRGIEIVPEVDVPGHTRSALAAYPELGCTGESMPVRTSWGIAEEVLCVGNPRTMEFLNDVLAGVAEIFPSRYLHLGGDECPTKAWENCPCCRERAEREGGMNRLHAAFFRDACAIAGRLGKQVIGWDEVVEHGGPPEIVGMVWREPSYATQALADGRQVVLCPNRWLYFDYPKDATQTGAPTWAPVVTLEQCYEFDPGRVEGADDAGLLGLQGCLWTEHVPDEPRLFEMLLPRIFALAERAWNGSAARPWPEFQNAVNRLEGPLLSALQVR